jgi:two-component system chemotaxis response regulator CheY
MRIHNDTTSSFIRTLADAIIKDPTSLDSWRCMHIHSTHSSFVDLPTISEVKEANKHLGCDIVRCADNDLLLISRELDEAALQCIAAALTEQMKPEETECQLYHLFHDWRSVRSLLLAKCPLGQSATKPEPQTENFGEVEQMRDAFIEMKRLRMARSPQYVLVVEDDALTRRIVANAFKDNYALVTAQTAQEAISQYLLYAPDVVFLDIGLPDMSGFAVLTQIVALDADAYVVMFSGNSYLDNVMKALVNGASGFIAKPFSRQKLNHYIEDSTAHHRKAMH